MLASELNWNVVVPTVVTGATAVLVALFSWLGNRTTATSAKQQREAEAQRLRDQREEEHLQHRQGIYHDLLNAERRSTPTIVNGELQPHERLMALYEVMDHINGALLFGTQEVATKCVSLVTVLNPVRADVDRNDAVSNGLYQTWLQTRREVLDAMRRDVATDTTAIEQWPALRAEGG